ncbi:Heavy metal transport/detoxification superfamily protein, putative [Theobroma cacao]|uniref:Heavy metal transport/detoxification superfamily protein, putative n=1 Tax=Theobroma cacao TaxID=3641 RepID=A0A061E5Z1_THECC|nr:Heavy metal transport/detoxification superfamily protein, putative [Theobroma cacao]
MGHGQQHQGGGQIVEVKLEKSCENNQEKGAKDSNKGKEIVLKVYMHCEGCAAKVFNCLKGFQGVEQVKTDMEGDRVIVKGQNADPLKILERVKKKYSRNAELISPKPKPKATDGKQSQNKQEPPIKFVVLKMYMHCEGCANDIKRSIGRMKGILNVEPDMKKSTVTVRGNFDPPKLVEAIAKQFGKYAEIVAEGPTDKANGTGKQGKEEEIMFHYPPQYSLQHIYPTQIFSDENILSCSIM